MDMISRLPDEILCHILSFLRTHEAVATPLVSKRWRNLWISVPALDLDHFEFRRATRKGWVEESLDIPSFENFVNATILARDERQPITRFRLLYESTVSLEGSDLVHDWLNTVMPRRIENLEICIPRLSRCIGLKIYSCRTLVVLKLKGVPLGVYVSSHVELPSLKSLHLEKVHFVDFQSFLKLICGCPLLEDLEAGTVSYLDRSFDREFRFRSLPKLVSVVINDYNFRFPLKIISNAEFLSIEERTFGRVTRVFNWVVPEFPNLVHVVFTSSGSLSWHFVFEILKNCPKLQDFELIFSRDPDSMTLLPYPQFIPECLTSQFRNCTLKNYKGTRCERLFAQDIMQHSTSLRTMKICSRSSLSTEAKHEMLKQLALCPRRSALCELSFT